MTLRVAVTVVPQTLQLELERGDARGGQAIRSGDKGEETALVRRREARDG